MAKILIIDDDKNIRDMLRMHLEDAGHKIIEAETGLKGIEAVRQNIIDLIITDIIMPDQEGITTIKFLIDKFPNIKIIAMSGGGHITAETYLDIAKKFGVKKAFTKPFKIKEILDAVQELL
ncbi:response regulator [Desulfobacterales bacterium HSG17]|nr:response regulator [Desulfobacterales bacterium HSG17]